MKLRIVVTILLLVFLIVAALALSPGQRVLAELPGSTPAQQIAPAR
jgi:hypothetical protein